MVKDYYIAERQVKETWQCAPFMGLSHQSCFNLPSCYTVKSTVFAVLQLAMACLLCQKYLLPSTHNINWNLYPRLSKNFIQSWHNPWVECLIIQFILLWRFFKSMEVEKLVPGEGKVAGKGLGGWIRCSNVYTCM
jgi:hypothetical protein